MPLKEAGLSTKALSCPYAHAANGPLASSEQGAELHGREFPSLGSARVLRIKVYRSLGCTRVPEVPMGHKVTSGRRRASHL